MLRFLLIGFLSSVGVNLLAAGDWRLNTNTYLTHWALDVSPEQAHAEYPRPTMTRPDWLNLNGIWEIGFSRTTNCPGFTNHILVPFPVESVLSGVRHMVNELEQVWYRRTFMVPMAWQGRQVLLHFEASDWETEVWLNGKNLGTHRGGYDRFSFDITSALKPGDEQELIVRVNNPIDAGSQPRGKQMLHPRLPYLHATSGIWQTAWLEPVAITSVESFRLVPDLDAGALHVEINGRGNTNDVMAEAVAYADGKEISRVQGPIGKSFSLPVPHAHTWSPDDPFLYDVKIALLQKGKKLDEVSGYFGMRKISVSKGADGYPRLYLNNRPGFEMGVLDQGYWPDGIYTAPNDEALRSDIELIKRLGFNMCRKHVKIEPERWYYWCDKLGLLVWQDMPSGGTAALPKDREIKRTPESAQQFEAELQRMIADRGNQPSIIMWILFNQGWGQYDTVRLTKMVKGSDPSRLVMDVSGWNDFGVGDVRSSHKYPGPASPEHDGRRAWVMGECGGLGLDIPGHTWGIMTSWNTTLYDSPKELTAGYDSLLNRIEEQKQKTGLAAAVITELTDAETEGDGLTTYDRDVIKLPTERVKAANEKVLGKPTPAE
jgi:Glycosyl hydrolases family 2, sugar binding domain/Glycosyl hydrolases family 2, TIM barrel domain/Glycosyl hydrolases family 2